METISAKQVEGAVDISTDQIIGGIKSFSSPVNFIPIDQSQFECMRMEGLYLYWTIDQTNLEHEGNFRFGPSQSLDCLTLQKRRNNQWQEYSPGDIFN
ncbi:MAG: hypothetical protein CFE21_10835 [Bacteroidetes bacterium B1(2017)]|nr:MAG: hypothetical protein CFE21_10835 [Bacteroidetes bacterium B1(2017)]